jgi:hypothetical protein
MLKRNLCAKKIYWKRTKFLEVQIKNDFNKHIQTCYNSKISSCEERREAALATKVFISFK